MKVFEASRLSSGNRVFPDKIKIEDIGITLKVPGLFNGKEKTLLYQEISSVEVDTPLVGFSKIKFKTQRDIIVCKGFTKQEVEEMKELVNMRITGNGNNTNSNSVLRSFFNNDTNNSDVEIRRLNIEEKQSRLERADKLRQEGRNIHALFVEYNEVVMTVGMLLLFGFCILLTKC